MTAPLVVVFDRKQQTGNCLSQRSKMHIDEDVKLRYLLAKLDKSASILKKAGPKLKAAISEARNELLERSRGERVPGK